MRRYEWAIAVMLLATQVHAAEPMVLTIENGKATPQKKFIALDTDKEKNQGIIITKEKKPIPLRSDRQAMEKGAMMLDRRLLKPMPLRPSIMIQPQQPSTLLKPDVSLPTAPAAAATLDANTGALERDSEEIDGAPDGADPVLSLFGASDVTPSSFRDAMSGRSTGTVAGVGKQAMWPVALDAKQYVSSGYGMRADPFNGRPTFHGGIDIAAPAGTAVLATADASVLQVEQDGNYGKYITLQHSNGMLSRYGHLSMQSVREGQRVRAGDIIGAVGATGRATGAHLDYRVSKDGMKFDPLTVLSVPSSVAMHINSPVPLAVAVRGVSQPATKTMHPISKAPMVIHVQ